MAIFNEDMTSFEAQSVLFRLAEHQTSEEKKILLKNIKKCCQLL